MEADKRMTTRERGLRDPIWQAIGAFIGLAALAAAVWFFFLQRDVKSVQVVVLAETSLVDIPSLVAGDVQVTYQGRPIPNLTLVQVKVENNGTAEVRGADYETPITVVFPEGAEVLDAQVLETKPADLGLQVEKQRSKAVLSPVLLNEGDRAIIRFVVAGLPAGWPVDSLAVNGRIAGVKELGVVSAVAEKSLTGDLFGKNSKISLLVGLLAFGLAIFQFWDIVETVKFWKGRLRRWTLEREFMQDLHQRYRPEGPQEGSDRGMDGMDGMDKTD